MSTSYHLKGRRTRTAAPAAKRVDIVKVQLVREKSMLYADRVIDRPVEAARLFRDFVGDADREHFVLLCLNTKNEPTHVQVVHIGALSSSIVHPREVFKTAIMANAASIICLHNHPSDRLQPSAEDREVTQRLMEAGEIIGIQLLDHVIVGSNSYYSIKHDFGD